MPLERKPRQHTTRWKKGKKAAGAGRKSDPDGARLARAMGSLNKMRSGPGPRKGGVTMAIKRPTNRVIKRKRRK